MLENKQSGESKGDAGRDEISAKSPAPLPAGAGGLRRQSFSIEPEVNQKFCASLVMKLARLRAREQAGQTVSESDYSVRVLIDTAQQVPGQVQALENLAGISSVSELTPTKFSADIDLRHAAAVAGSPLIRQVEAKQRLRMH